MEKFYNESGDISEFKQYFEPNFLNNLIQELEFYAGKNMQKDSTFNSAKFEKLKDEVKIELLDCNKELFKKEDRIQIVAELKNTPQLYVKIYEFDRKTDFSGCR